MLSTLFVYTVGAWSGTALMWGAAMSDEKTLKEIMQHECEMGEELC